MAKKKDHSNEDWYKNELEVADLLSKVEEFSKVQRHPNNHSGYDIGGCSSINFTGRELDSPWKSPYYDDTKEGFNIAVEVKLRREFYHFPILEEEKARNMIAEIQKDRAKRKTIPLYCVSYTDKRGRKIHQFYDVRWITECNNLTDGMFNDQTEFNATKAYTNEGRQGVKIKKKVWKFKYTNDVFRFVDGEFQIGEAYEVKPVK